ncbi:MAG: ABC transporter permease [Proteobacteria bacterium]|nr:ABC transporter permease [Pseudomonadota bacterium]
MAGPLLFFSLLAAGVIAALLTRVSWPELSGAFGHPETRYALGFSLVVSAGAMAVAVSIGAPSAYFLARQGFPGKGVLETLLDLPLVMPPLVAGVGLLFLFGRDLLGGPLARVGIHLILTPWGAVAAQAFIATPIVIRAARTAFESVDPGYEETARTLGLKPLTIFLRVNLPLAGRGIVSGLILAWARAMGEFGATLMVAGATRFRTESLPIAVYLNLSSGEVGIAVSCALVLLGAAFVMLLAARFVQKRGAGADPGRGDRSWPTCA